MNGFLLINEDQLTIHSWGETAEYLETVEDTAMVGVNSLIISLYQRSFAKFTHFELRKMIHNIEGSNQSENASYVMLLHMVYEKALEMVPLGFTAPKKEGAQETSVETGDPPTPPVETESPAVTKVADTQPPCDDNIPKPGKALKRPKDGTTAAIIWGYADVAMIDMPDEGIDGKKLRAWVINSAVEGDSVNKSTATTQFGKWKKYQKEQ